ncbi:hypothetical protein FB451DRAFT_181168 [Mycena latifolia]|nr:hypothetical protein FB451DRAFT_181168 [Mycena latifolia]
MKSSLFKDQMPDAEADPSRSCSPSKWIDRIKTKFKNRAMQIKNKSTGGSSSKATPHAATNVPATASGKSFFGCPNLTAKRLFEIEKKDDINGAATARAAADGLRRPLERFQTVKKQMWADLSDEQQDDYKERAQLLQNDAGINQGAFASAIWPDMDAFVKSGLFGKMTMTLLYAYRTPEDTLVRGHASVHSVKEAPYFDESADWDSKVWAPWKQYAEEALP